MKKEIRTDNSVMQIKLAFVGAILNLRLLEDAFMNRQRIPLSQYVNYVSQLAFCVELGFKSMIINTSDIEQIHDLEVLFSMAPEVFQKRFKSMCPGNIDFNSSLSNTKNIFVEFRYMKPDGLLKEYLDENVVDSNNTINFKKVASISQFQFLLMLLEEILEYERFMHEESLKLMQNPDFKDVDAIIAQYIALSKEIQSSAFLQKKDESDS